MNYVYQKYFDKRVEELFKYSSDTTYTTSDYKIVVRRVSQCLAELSRILHNADNGIEPDVDYVSSVMDNLAKLKDLLLDIKKALGFDAELSAFSTDLNLFGIEFKNGRFTIHKGHEDTFAEETLTTARSFVNDVTPTRETAFNYEAMMLAAMFVYPFVKDESPKDKVVEKSKKKMRIWHKLVKRLRREVA